MIVRLEGLVDRRMRRLGLVLERKHEPAPQTLQEYLAVAAEQAASAAEGESDARAPPAEAATSECEGQDHGP